jgi:hypothetical protein
MLTLSVMEIGVTTKLERRFLNSQRPSHQSWVFAKDRELLDRTSPFKRRVRAPAA